MRVFIPEFAPWCLQGATRGHQGGPLAFRVQAATTAVPARYFLTMYFPIALSRGTSAHVMQES
eukprot:9473259-Pyramimonas_sp.AAC.1